MGSFEKRGEGSYRLTVVIGYKPNGKPIRERRSVKAKNKTEARKLLSRFETEVLSGHYIQPEHMTLQAFYGDWQEKYAAERFTPATRRNYELIIDARILPTYGHMRLSDIKPIHIVNFMEDLKKNGRRLDGKDGPLSTSSVINAYKAFHSLLSCAHQWRLIPENPSASVKPPVPKRKKSTLAFSAELVWDLIRCIETEPMEKRLLFWIAFVTSAREGEIAALEEKHINKESHTITFEQSLTATKRDGLVIKSIKNNLEGEAAIPEELVEMIDQLTKRNKKELMRMRNKRQFPDHAFLFCNEYGKPIRPDSISQWWARFIRKHDLPKIRFHDLRHMSITFLIGKNVPMKSISERARHSNIGTTMDIYGHNIVEVDRVAASHFSAFFQQKNGNF